LAIENAVARSRVLFQISVVKVLEAKRVFRVIEGGYASPAPQGRILDARSQVHAEGQRRLQAAGVQRYESRERLAGIPMPSSFKHFKLQIEFAMAALSQLEPVPADYMLDGYWPTYK